jgi:hypothetical protein
MAYIRHLDGDSEVILGARLLPSSGPWHRLVRKIRSYIPSSFIRFQPGSVDVSVFRGSSGDTSIAWPFSSQLPLSAHTDPEGEHVQIRDSKVIAFLWQHMTGGFSWLQCNLTEDAKPYSLEIAGVPGWYDRDHIAMTLGLLAYDAREDRK